MEPSIFMQSTQHQGMFPGSSIAPSPSMNSPIPGLGQFGPMAAMFLEPQLQNMFGSTMIPGQFFQTHNLYDQYRRRAQYSALQNTMSAASERDQMQYASMLRGMAATAGVQWNGERERAAQKMAADMGAFAPMLAQMMPDTFDAMHGTRGSATLMAQGMFMGGRYRIDPVSGQLGMSGESASMMSRELYDRLYGPGANLSDMKGLGAGRAGQAFDELSRRGLLVRSLSRTEQIRGIAAEMSGKGDGDITKTMADLEGLSSPQLETKIRQFEAGRVGDRLKSLAGAISAMKDIFGEMGRPDAPMSQIIEGLQSITQGGLGSMSPERIEQTVRNASVLARRSGMGMDNMTMLMAGSAQRAEMMGMDRSLGVQAAMGSSSFASAYGNMWGGSVAFGRADKERMMAIDNQLRLNAGSSPLVNQMAATMRLGQDVGFTEGSEAAAMFKAIKDEQSQYTFNGVTKSVNVKAADWRNIMVRGGVNAGVASAYRSHSASNQQAIEANNLQDLGREMQGEVDAVPVLSRAFTSGARQAGFSKAQSAKIGQLAASGLLDDINPDDIKDPDKVAMYLAGKLGIDQGDAAAMKQLRSAAAMGRGSLDQIIKMSPRLSGFKTGDQYIGSMRRDVAREARNQRTQARIEADLQGAMSGFASGGPLARMMDAIAGAGTNTTTKDIIGKTLGYHPPGEVGEELDKVVDSIRGELKTFHGTDDVKVRRAAIDKITKLKKDMFATAEKAGLETGGLVPAMDLERASQSYRDGRAGAVQEGESVTTRMLMDDKTMAVLGEGGLKTINAVLGRNAEMKKLAAEHAGGNIGVLMASDEQRAAAQSAKKEIDRLFQQRSALEAALTDAENKGQKGDADKLRAAIHETDKNIHEAQLKLDEVGRRAGVDGETLAKSGGPSKEVRDKIDSLKGANKKDLDELQLKIKAGKVHKLSAEENKNIAEARQLRTRSGNDVMNNISKALNMNIDGADKTALANEITGERGNAIRMAADSLQKLRTMKSTMSGDEFQDYLARGPGSGASEDEKRLYDSVSAGKVGGGLAGINRHHLNKEDIRSKLRDFASWQKEETPNQGSKKVAANTSYIEGTITIPGLGTGTLNAKDRRA